MILHIPHSGLDTLGRKIELFDINELTDHYTDKLFWHDNTDRMVQPVSRFVCDVERFPDDKEPMYNQGQGICYTKGTRNNDIEVIDKDWIIENVYNKWHINLNKLVAKNLTMFPKVVVVDCHSFSDKEGHPDFCIGTTKQTPLELSDKIFNLLNNKGYEVGINFPYQGSIIPTNYIDNQDVFAIMIEVNKKLYMESTIDFETTKKLIAEVLNIISEYEYSFVV